MDHIVNLSEFVQGSEYQANRKLSKNTKVPDVAGHLRRRHLETLALTKVRQQQQQLFSPVHRDLQASTIETCPSGNSTTLICKPADPDGLYDFKKPAYGGGGGYDAAVASVRGGPFWDGEPSSRTDTDGYAVNLLVLASFTLANDLADIGCGSIDDDIDICIFFVNIEVPNPFRIICEIANGILSGIALSFETIKAQLDFQDSRVNGAEIEAAYEHTNNILHKQCAIFDQVRCKVAENPGFGSGCDGIDTNCNGNVVS